MEKILFSNNIAKDIYGISNTGNILSIQFKGADMAELEDVFSSPELLKKLVLQDSDGNAMAAFKNYAIFREISKKKNVIVDEITEETADIVTVMLEQEPEWLVAQREMQTTYDAAILDLGATVGSMAEGGQA